MSEPNSPEAAAIHLHQLTVAQQILLCSEDGYRRDIADYKQQAFRMVERENPALATMAATLAKR